MATTSEACIFFIKCSFSIKFVGFCWEKDAEILLEKLLEKVLKKDVEIFLKTHLEVRFNF